MSLAAKIFWGIPGSFDIARALGPGYSLRCVVFHHIASEESPFTHGINVRTSPEDFEKTLQFIVAHYTPVRLDEVLDAGRKLPPRAMLVTFDDAYASVVNIAAPLCKKYCVPAVFFVNAAFLDNQRLAADNLVCYAARMDGMKPLNVAARQAVGPEAIELRSLAEVFGEFFPALTLVQRRTFIEALKSILQIDECRLAKQAALYLSSDQLRSLAAFDFEIGNHTYRHVHCRRLSAAEVLEEIDQNKAALEAISRTHVRAFSQPYGSSADLTPEILDHLKSGGHKAAFLSESVANEGRPCRFVLDRINPRTGSDSAFFFDIEVLPRLRAIRDRHFRNIQKPVTHTAVSLTNDAREMNEQHLAL
jgi:peptidoglycan/xylan/chitin deacetylase (PgdA/CDA1 family)